MCCCGFIRRMVFMSLTSLCRPLSLCRWSCSSLCLGVVMLFRLCRHLCSLCCGVFSDI